MRKPEYILENEAPKILWDFEIQMVYSVLIRRPNLKLIDKKKKKELVSL